MVRVWFNHWFSTSYGLIEFMKKDKTQEIYVIGSNKQYDSVIQLVCDEWYEEPLAEGEAYIEFCLAFCKEHKIDVFVPRKNMVEISKNRDKFTEIGVKVLVDDYEMIRILNDKAAAYEMFQVIEGLYIPHYEIVNNAEEFEKAYKKLKALNSEICVKFVQDEGAMSYRKIVDNVNRVEQLSIYPGADVPYETYLATLKEAGTFADLMVMEYLPGNEISVDCLNTKQGLIAIPRYKGNARPERVAYDEHILKMSKDIMEKINLQCPCNIQFRLKEDKPYLLEINTRMSGGLQMSCLAAEINIPNIALNKLLGIDLEWSYEQKERVVSYIEIPKMIP